MKEKVSHYDERSKRLIAMGEMAASLAHEIRNPLGSMELYCSLLKKDLSGEAKLLSLAEHIHSGIKSLDRIITSCLQFARDHQPRCILVSDVKTMLSETIKGVSSRASSSGVQFVSEYIGQNKIYVDPYLISQAILNLLINALDAVNSCDSTQDRFVKLTSDTSQEGIWVVKVMDNGQGIPLENQEKIFDPFYTTKCDGTGLGLAIVHSIVSAHGGQIEIESNFKDGTTVTIKIPYSIL
jgi:signal transduction histidine kinase